MTEVEERIALVTGGSSGIGYAVASRLAENGDRVVICGRDAERAAAAASRLTSNRGQVDSVAADVTDLEDVERLVSTVVDRYGRIDILVNNAGGGGGGETRKISDELWETVITANLTSTFRVTRSTLERSGMLERGWGRIINIASTGGKQGVILAAPYSAAKHGVVGFSKAVGLELAKSGVTVNAVCPGYVETPMAVGVRRRYATHWKVTEEEVLERFNAKIPLGRYTQPSEVAGMVAYLASPDADPVTAQAINVCGGLGNY